MGWPTGPFTLPYLRNKRPNQRLRAAELVERLQNNHVSMRTLLEEVIKLLQLVMITQLRGY